MFSQTRCRKLLIHPPYSSYNSQGTQTAAKHPPTHLTVLTHSLTNRLDSNRIGYTSSGNFKSDLHVLVFIFLLAWQEKNWLSVISHLLQCPPNVIQYPGYVCQLLCYWNGSWKKCSIHLLSFINGIIFRRSLTCFISSFLEFKMAKLEKRADSVLFVNNKQNTSIKKTKRKTFYYNLFASPHMRH